MILTISYVQPEYNASVFRFPLFGFVIPGRLGISQSGYGNTIFRNAEF